MVSNCQQLQWHGFSCIASWLRYISLQDSGIDDDVLVVTEDFDDLMDEDAVVLPESLKGGVRHLLSLSLLPG